MLATLSTSPKQKEKQKREPSMYFKARRSTRIKTSRPKEKQSKGPITIVETPSKQMTSITYERGSPKTSTWKEMMENLNSEASL